MEEPTFRSWGASTSSAETVAERRRERRRRWIRPHTLTVVLGVVALDAAVVLGVSAIAGARRSMTFTPCDTFWPDLAHQMTTGLWIVGALLVVTVLIASRWRWVLVATLVVQVVVAATVIPSIIHQRSEFTAVAEGRLSPVDVDTGGAACG